MSRIRITLFFILVLGTRLFATDLTLEQALQSAKATNITAQNAKIALEKQLNQANSNQYLPSINISAGSSASVSLLEQNSSAQISPTASISFSLSSTDRYTKASNSLLAKTAQTTYNSSILNLEMQVLQAYWSVAAAQLAYEQQQAATEQTRASYESIQAHYEQGLTNSLAVSQAKLAYSQSSLTLGSRKTDYETAKQELQNLVGYEFEETADELWDTQSLKPLADLQDLALGTSSIQLLAYQIEQAELALKKTRASSASPHSRLQRVDIAFQYTVHHSRRFTA
ncbi:MAG: TolC family protein [Sphaerochaeta sp.]|nr:TolC family protein [Sphaerochaeta sp.]